MYSTLSFKTS
jgi:hypothetical protein